MTDESGGITDRYDYTAFGELLEHAGTDSQPYRFVGEPYDPNTGFYYNRARWLDPAVGRFVRPDPFRGVIHDPLTLHRYLYAGADPVNNVDPTGNFFTVGSILGALSINVAVQVISATVVFGTLVVGSKLFRLGICLRALALEEMGSGKLGPEGWIAAENEFRLGSALIQLGAGIYEQFFAIAAWFEVGQTGVLAFGIALIHGAIEEEYSETVPPLTTLLGETISHGEEIEHELLDLVLNHDKSAAVSRSVQLCDELTSLRRSVRQVLTHVSYVRTR